MTSDTSQPNDTSAGGPLPPRSSALARYGPVAAILAVVALIGGLAVTGGSARDDGPDELDVAAPSSLPVIFPEAEAAGEVEDYDWGPTCDLERGTVMLPTVYAPPCVPEFTGPNGGDTAPGVTSDSIKVVVYRASTNGDLAALLQGLTDPPEQEAATRQVYLDMFSDVLETYGRQVELVEYQGTGAADDEVAARADAVAVAEEVGAFASLGAPALTNAYATELAARGVLCLGCGLSAPDQLAQDNAPYLWNVGATPEQFLTNLGDYVTERLLNEPAEHAGDPEWRDRTRTFGTVHFEQKVPVFGEVEALVRERGRERGWEPLVNETYLFDIPSMPARAATIIAKLKEAEVTTVIFLGDPIMPIYLTQEATKQGYRPEWIVTGTALTDTTVLGRLYDQSQWAHAFGVSSLAARAPREQGDAWRLHEWYAGTTPAAPNTNALLLPGIQQLMTGIHLAGPDLSAQTFKAGMFKAPPVGGGPTSPRLSYGMNGLFELADGSPRPDYMGIDDVTEIWWDADQVGPSEQGKEGTGMWRYANGATRYLPGEMPDTPPDAFTEAGSITVFDERPEEDRAPDYPPPPGAPTAGG